MAKTEKLYVLGHPVAHSKSPAMYNAVYPKMGLNWHYDFMDCECAEEAEVFIAARDYLAINVTMPYKPHALALATTCAASAALAGGANVLARKGESLIAYNTDGTGCMAYLKRCGVELAGARVVVCGTGPTSLAIMHAAAQAGAAEVALLGRDGERARAVLECYKRGRRDCKVTQNPSDPFCSIGGDYGACAQLISEADLIVDATPLGMKSADPAPFDVTLLRGGQTVFDVVYGHGETALAAGARAVGARFFDGAGMLVGQAVETVGIVCDLNGVDRSLSDDELFALMARAAGFDC